jgi:hypothetical protein
MEHMLSRSAAECNPGSGLLLAEHFQMAYVTTDMEQALDLFRTRLGIRKFSRLEGQMPAGGRIRLGGHDHVRGDLRFWPRIRYLHESFASRR